MKSHWSGSHTFSKRVNLEVILLQMVAAFSKFILAKLSHDGLGLNCFSPTINLISRHSTSSEITAEAHYKRLYFEHFPPNP